MNKTLFFASFKANWKLLLGVFLLLFIYISTIIGMYDPENAKGMEAIVATLPPAMVSAFGFNAIGYDLTNHIGTYLYGFIFLIMPVIYSATVANKLIARHVDRGSMVYLLTTPNTRKKIVLTQAIFLFSSTFFLLFMCTAMGIVISEMIFPGILDIGNFLMLNLVTVAVHLVFCGITFLASCIFSESKNSIMVGAGIPLLFLMFKMLSSVGDKLSGLKYISLLSIIDVPKIFSDHAFAWWSSGLLLLISVLLLLISVRVFDKKSMNI
jgi:ABC-2 type transport system permease protein